MVWICTLLAVWCGCVAYHLRNGDQWVWFAAPAALLIVFGILPANCAAWAVARNLDPESTQPLETVAVVSALVYAIVGFISPGVFIVALFTRFQEWVK